MNIRMTFWMQWFCILLVCMVDRISCEVVVHSVTLGKTSWGEWSDEMICPDGAKVTGFRLQVEEDGGFWFDDTALNGIQLECGNEDDTDKIEGPFGKWNDWVTCLDEHYVTGFNFRSERNQGMMDDVAGVNVKMRCNDGKELDGDGIDEWGNWDKRDYEKCPLNSYFCGVQAQIEHDANGDHTGLNKMKFLCCSTGDGDWSAWSTWTRCSHTCGEGTRKKKRSCPNGQLCMTLEGKRSSAEYVSESCKMQDCPACLRENGFCVTENDSNQNEGVIKLNDVDGDSTDAQNKCLESCFAHNGATGCEVIWDQDNRGCYVHTKEISRGNAAPRHYCWIFSKCTDTSRCDLIRCNTEFQPVCGSNHVTYRNKCTLDVAICKDDSIELEYHGPCDGPSHCDMMLCPAEHKPVCASNGKTYSNNCTLGIANCKDTTIKFRHNGNCTRQTTCKPTEFQCSSGTCILQSWKCDGEVDCGDGSDEAQCSNATCSPNYFQCPDGHCIRMSWKCDGDNDCGDFTDELNCSFATTLGPPVSTSGPCKKICAEIHEPVCGLNGVTYGNKCELRNAICDNSKIKLAYKGRCGGLGLTKCRRENIVEDRVVGKFIPRCTFEGLYEILQCHGSTGYCWCANQYTGKEISGTSRGPGEERLSISKCIAAMHVGLIGVWRYTSTNGGGETHRISADGKVKREDRNGNQLGFANLTPSNDQRQFPTSKGWVMMVGLHGKLTSQYIRWNKDDTVDTFHFCLMKCKQVVDFCESSCDARYKSKNFYCCAAKGIKKLTKAAKHRGEKGKFTFSLLLDVMEGDIKHYDVIVTELGRKPRFPRDNPHSYTNEDIEDNVDGLYVAGRVADKESFGKMFVVGESNGRSRRSLAEPDNRPLKKDVYYGVFVRGYITEDDYTTSSWYPPTKASSEKSDSWKTAIAVVVVVVLVVIVAVLVIIHRWKKRKNFLKDASDQTSWQASNPAYIPDDGIQLEPISNFTPGAPPPYEPMKNVNIDNFAAGACVELNEKPGIPDDVNYERINRVVPNVYEIAADPNRVYQDPDNDKSLEDTANQPKNIRASQAEDESWKVRPRPRPSRKELKNENNNIEMSSIPQTSPTNPFRSDAYEPNYQDPSIQHPGDPFTGTGAPAESFYHEIGTPVVKYNVPTGVTFVTPNTPPPDYSELNNTVTQQPINLPMPGYNRLDNSIIPHDPMIQPAYSELHKSDDSPRPCNEPAPGYNKLANSMISNDSIGKQSSLQPYEQISGIPEGSVGLAGATDSAFMNSGVGELNAACIDSSFGLYDNPHCSVPRLSLANDAINNADSNV